ncbi:MAG: hypothetical protein HYU43_00035, partial [Armatimonadetes bacterium]|nr:hypothetical protein [Armatimonadota bacterium]
AVNRLALVSPHVAFRMIHEGDDVLRYPAGRQDDRIAAVLGRTLFDRMTRIPDAMGDLMIAGWLGKPELARAVRRHQYLFVNRRAVHSRVVGGAIDQGYQQLIPAGRFPVYVVFAELPGHRVDINVHPRKLEVRFDDDHQVFAAVSTAVRGALRTVPMVPTVGAVAAPATPAGPPLTLGDFTGFTPATEPVTVARTGRLPAMRLLGQLHGTYLMAQSEEGLVVIDQHAAHERILYERLLRSRERSAADGQLLVEPVPVTLSIDEAAVLRDHMEILEEIGFGLEPFGDRTVLIRNVPVMIRGRSAETLLRDLLAELVGGPRLAAAQAMLERLTIATACHTAIRAGDRLAPEQMAALLRDLAQSEDPFTCFHGRPTLVTIPIPSVERWFLRK